MIVRQVVQSFVPRIPSVILKLNHADSGATDAMRTRDRFVGRSALCTRDATRRGCGEENQSVLKVLVLFWYIDEGSFLFKQSLMYHPQSKLDRVMGVPRQIEVANWYCNRTQS